MRLIHTAIITLTLFSLTLSCYLLGYHFNHSTSYPFGIYRLTTQQTHYTKGELILFCPPNKPILHTALERHYLNTGRCEGGFEPVIKKIFGVAGDKISFTQTININNTPVPHTRRLQKDSHDRPLPQLSNFIISPHHIFVLSDHKPVISFDSRYYGEVNINNVIGGIKPILTH
ncbi:conjugative transfer signal peptidase TraF [Photobacterium leiognathi]|uniref:conjugative transfer signal peptidase TraF n=1 Tax=Photobacterium leiognathi TaxID=553611 RepID=UPI0029825D96|nr:conjugative transfer signal peptidase TraF [Photobacterium leiognathi]